MWTQRRSGQQQQRGPSDHRSPYERDRTRVIHCAAFRRLQRKTQILRTDVGDFHRTRLTHSLEVASIGSSIVNNLNIRHANDHLPDLLPSHDLMQVICLLHDIGHPPFGHGGEVALNCMMQAHGGFESNAQTLRLLTKTEDSYSPFGLDLTRRSLFGILKYPVCYSKTLKTRKPEGTTGSKTLTINNWIPPKAYFDSEQNEIDWLLSPFQEQEKVRLQSFKKLPDANHHGKAAFKGLDCSIMNVADDIAYGVHDLEDAIHLQLVHRSDLDTDTFKNLVAQSTFNQATDNLLNLLFSQDLAQRKQAIGELVNFFIAETLISETHADFENPMLKYNLVQVPEAHVLLDHLKQCIFDKVIDSPEARTFEHGGQMIVLRLFEAINANPESLLDAKYRTLYKNNQHDETAARRVVCDYIANMTDEYARHLYERLFGIWS